MSLLLLTLDGRADLYWGIVTPSLLLLAQRLKWATEPITKIEGYHRNYMLMLIIVPHCQRSLKAIFQGEVGPLWCASFACWNFKKFWSQDKDCFGWVWNWLFAAHFARALNGAAGGKGDERTPTDRERINLYQTYNVLIVSESDSLGTRIKCNLCF